MQVCHFMVILFGRTIFSIKHLMWRLLEEVAFVAPRKLLQKLSSVALTLQVASVSATYMDVCKCYTEC